MKRLTTVLCTLVLFAFTLSVASAADIVLYDAIFNVNGAISEPFFGDPLPAELNAGAFDFNTGLGTLAFTITGAGNHSVITFLDHEIDEAVNTFFNENGAVNGAPAAGQSWEIDDPQNYIIGDVYAGSLFNSNELLSLPPDPVTGGYDVSMALGWDFTLAPLETAYINFVVAETAPNGFYLSHTDPETLGVTGGVVPTTIYFSSNLTIRGGQEPPIPEPGTWILMLTGLALTGGIAAKRSKRSK